MSKAALDRIKKTYFGRILHEPSQGYVMGDVPVGSLAEIVRDYEKALALIAEMRALLAYAAPFCDERDDYEARMALVARAEELLRD